MGGEFAVERMGEMRALDSTHPGRVGPMRWFEIEEVGVGVNAGRSGDDFIGDPAQGREGMVVENVLDEGVAVVAVLGDRAICASVNISKFLKTKSEAFVGR